jgi:DNA-binding NarL/FixJ family response regulator
MINIAIVDDHQLFRKSLHVLINGMEGLEVVYDSDNGNDFLEFVKKKLVDLVLLDIQMPIINGYDICKLLKTQNPNIKILIISQLTTKEAIHHVMECGANGFFTKNASPENLEMAIHKIMEEDYYFDIGLSSTIREAILWDKKTTFDANENTELKLSEREIQIIKLVCQEKSTNEIADLLKISSRTVETYRNKLIKRLKVKNFVGVILYAFKSDEIHLDDI